MRIRNLRTVALCALLAIASSCSLPEADATPTGGRVAGQPWVREPITSVWGFGYDGALTFDGTTAVTLADGTVITPSSSTYTLPRSIFATTITFSNSARVLTRGAIIYARGDILGTGTIANTGNDASGITAGAFVANGIIPGGFGGGNGGAASVVGTGAAAATTFPMGCAVTVGVSSSGFAANTSGSAMYTPGHCNGGMGGKSTQNAGTVNTTALATNSSHALVMLNGRDATGTQFNGCQGGSGGGGGSGAGNGGGGGGAAGWIVIHAHSIATTITIDDRGGKGGDATGASGGAGGGGGAGCWCIVHTFRGTHSCLVDGGLGGAGNSGAGAGGQGGSGINLSWSDEGN